MAAVRHMLPEEAGLNNPDCPEKKYMQSGMDWSGKQ